MPTIFLSLFVSFSYGEWLSHS